MNGQMKATHTSGASAAQPSNPGKPPPDSALPQACGLQLALFCSFRIDIEQGTVRTGARLGRRNGAPADAWLQGGWYHYTPRQALPEALRLTRSEFTPE